MSPSKLLVFWLAEAGGPPVKSSPNPSRWTTFTLHFFKLWKLKKLTSKKVRSWSCFRSFSVPWVEVHVQKISNQAARLRNNGSSGHLCVAICVRSTSWEHPLQAHLALDKGGGRFVVHRGEGSNVADQLVKQSGFKQISFLGDERLFCENNILCCCRVCREKPPVDKATIPD